MKTAEEHKREALKCLDFAYNAMIQAQNYLAPVRGEGMADIYSEIADVYQDELRPLIGKLRKAKPTGLAEL